jgi:predicted PurR-regulated permease PerM
MTISPPLRNRRKRTPGWQSRDVVRAAALVMGLYWGARLFWFAHPLFLTTFLGVLFGLAVASGVDWLQRWRIPRGIAAALIVLTFIGALVAFGAAVAPILRSQASELRVKLPEAIDRLDHWITAKQGSLAVFGKKPATGTAGKTETAVSPETTATGKPVAPIDTQHAGVAPATPPDSSQTLRERIGEQASHLTKYLFSVITSTIAVVAGLFLMIFMSIYIASDPGLYHRGLMALFPHRHRDRVGEVLSAVATVLRKWLVTQLIAMGTIGAVSTVVLLVLGVKAAFALGVIAGLLEFVPTIGPILSSLPAIAMGFLDSPEKALTVAAAYVAIQFLENHILIPLLMKGGIDLPPVLTILAQALMALMFGFLGLMCAVPILAAASVAVRMLYVEAVIGKPVPPGESADIPAG